MIHTCAHFCYKMVHRAIWHWCIVGIYKLCQLLMHALTSMPVKLIALGETSGRVVMTSWNGNIFHIMGPLCGDFTGNRWIPIKKGQWRRALMFSLISAWINGWVNNREAGDLRRNRSHYDVTVMVVYKIKHTPSSCHSIVNMVTIAKTNVDTVRIK